MSENNNKQRKLGRGLSALLGDNAGAAAVIRDGHMPVSVSVEKIDKVIENSPSLSTPLNLRHDVPVVDGIRLVKIFDIHPGPFQPRRSFNQEAIEELADSIKKNGVLQPILVRLIEPLTSRYEIIAGERRWRAAKLAGLDAVPVIVRNFNDQESLQIALIENLQRQDLSPLEEANGYKRLMEEFEHTQEELSLVVGKSRSHIANMVRLLQLPDPIKTMVDDGRLSAGHARALLSVAEPMLLAQEIINKGLNVRQTEKLASKPQDKKIKPHSVPKVKEVDLSLLESDLYSLLGVKVEIKSSSEGAGELKLFYTSLEQLDDILTRLSGKS